MPFSVVIVDDDCTFRAVARRLLTRRGLEVVGEAGDGATGVELARTRRPNGVLLDVNLPDANGLSVARRLAVLPAAPRTVLTTTDPVAFSDPELDGARVAAFVPKERLASTDLPGLFSPRGT